MQQIISDAALVGMIGRLHATGKRIGLSHSEEQVLVCLNELLALRNGQKPHDIGEAPETVTGKLAWMANNYAAMHLQTSRRKVGVTLELYSPEGQRVVWASEPTIHEVIGSVFEQLRPVNFEPQEVAE